MEKLKNCEILIDIEHIENISGGDQKFEILFSTKKRDKHKLKFNYVWDMRYSIENGYIERGSKFVRDEEQESSILIVEDSEYLKYFKSQISGTLPIDELKNYILFDAIDTVVEILALDPPILEKM